MSRLVMTRHVRRVEPMHFGCVELSNSMARHARLDALDTSKVSYQDVTWRAKWNLGLTHGEDGTFRDRNPAIYTAAPTVMSESDDEV